jgi:hypothetical protein
MTNTSALAGQIIYFYTDPNSGRGIPCAVLSSDDGSFDIELISGQRGWVTAGELYCEDESGRYLGGPSSD